MSNVVRRAYISELMTSLYEWFGIHGKVLFTVVVFDIFLIVFCAIYWNMNLPVNPLRTTSTIEYVTTNWFPSSTMFDSLNAEVSTLIYKFYFIVIFHLVGLLLIAYSLMNIHINQRILLQNILDMINDFSQYKNVQQTNMQTIARLMTDVIRREPTTQVLNVVEDLRTICDNQNRSSLILLNKIQQEVRTMRMEYHNDDQVDDANTSVEAVTPLSTTRRRRSKKSSNYSSRP